MRIVKVRRVGNSNVITLPKDLGLPGFEPGCEIVLDATADGGLHILPASKVSEDFRDVARRVVRENREALDLLAAYDRGELTEEAVKPDGGRKG